MSVCGRNWCDILCKNGYVGMSVKEIKMSGMKHYVMKKWIVYMYLKK